MITAKHLSELASFKTPSPAVLSLYLELDGSGRHARSFEKMLAELALREPLLQGLPEDLRRMADFVAREFEPGSFRGLAVFSAKRFGLWRVCPLPQPVKDRLWLDRKPYLPPLVSITDHCQRFGVAIVSPRRCRFLEACLGQIKEYAEMDFEVRTDGAGPHPYLKEAADRLGSLARSHAFDRVIVAAAPALEPLLVERLRAALRNNLILEPGLKVDSAAPEILARILAREAEARKVQESVLARRVVDMAAARRQGVAGLSNTLFALQKGQVRLLLVRDGFAKLGRRCPGCGALSLGDTRCAPCRAPTQAVFNLVEEIVQKALDLKCEVFRLLHDTALDSAGKIAAELSFDSSAESYPSSAALVPEAKAC